jgi:hypothetical protein
MSDDQLDPVVGDETIPAPPPDDVPADASPEALRVALDAAVAAALDKHPKLWTRSIPDPRLAVIARQQLKEAAPDAALPPLADIWKAVRTHVDVRRESP